MGYCVYEFTLLCQFNMMVEGTRKMPFQLRIQGSFCGCSRSRTLRLKKAKLLTTSIPAVWKSQYKKFQERKISSGRGFAPTFVCLRITLSSSISLVALPRPQAENPFSRIRDCFCRTSVYYDVRITSWCEDPHVYSCMRENSGVCNPKRPSKAKIKRFHRATRPVAPAYMHAIIVRVIQSETLFSEF